MSETLAVLYVSVIICTHNPRPQYLARVLRALRSQTLPIEQWELLVIDNASRERLTASTCDLSWHPRGRIVREEELGLSVARMRGMREAAATLLVFVDDDNVLEPDYLAQALKIGCEWPQLGVWGGSIMPEFEVEPPEHLREFLGYLALRQIDAPRWSNVSTSLEATPWGAGMCVRADVARAYCQCDDRWQIRLNGRQGNALGSGDDVEICVVACRAGFGMAVFPILKLVHLIPEERLDEDYIVRLAEGIQTSAHLLNRKWQGTLPRSPFSPFEILRFCKNFALKRGIHRRMYLSSVRARMRARSIISSSHLDVA